MCYYGLEGTTEFILYREVKSIVSFLQSDPLRDLEISLKTVLFELIYTWYRDYRLFYQNVSYIDCAIRVYIDFSVVCKFYLNHNLLIMLALCLMVSMQA